MPALEQLAAEIGAGQLEVQNDVDASGPAKGAVDQVQRAVGGENVDDAFLGVQAVQGSEEDGLVLGFVDGLPVAQGQIHVVEEDDAAALDAEQGADSLLCAAANLSRLLIVGRRNDAPFPAAAATLFPDPAAGHGLAVAG